MPIMPKRPASELKPTGSKSHALGTGAKPWSKRQSYVNEADERGEFEDPWEDEIESDREQGTVKDYSDANRMDVDDEVPVAGEDEDVSSLALKTFIPGKYGLAKDEVLEPDQSTYVALHSMRTHWPCLSFDILRDNLGDERSRFPETSFVVTGTQAASAKENELIVLKMSRLHRTQKDDESSSEDDDDDTEDVDEDAVAEYRSIAHPGGVNRLRAQPILSGYSSLSFLQPYYVSTWADTGKVHIYNIRSMIESLEVPGLSLDKARTDAPVFTITSHGREEGFAMDWASSGANSSALRLLTGDINSKIYLTTSTPSSFIALPQPFVSHHSSIEDLQWSPAEPTVFASCSADRSIRIWDVRAKGRKSIIGLEAAHETDVNVISWNKITPYLLLSGGDEGAIKTWDLRSLKSSSEAKPSPVASFIWHQAPITSIEWHPTEDSVFAASGEDDQITLWDLSVEHDEDETGPNEDSQAGAEIPAQLLFVHLGQKDIKEVHWHPQIPGAIISTARAGLNFFKTISV